MTPLYPACVRPHWWYHVQFCTLKYKIDIDIVAHVQLRWLEAGARNAPGEAERAGLAQPGEGRLPGLLQLPGGRK